MLLTTPITALLLATTLAGGEPRQTPLLERVVVVGASVSGGYGLQPEIKAAVSLGDFLDCMLSGERRPTVDLGDVWLFRDPGAKAPKMVEQALAAEPTLVIAIDFLFWFGYTSWTSGPDRLADLQRGLALLERFDCPLVVGTFPDMTIATQGMSPYGFPLIVDHMIPSPSERERLNARVREWAQARGGKVLVFPLDGLVQRMIRGEEIALRSNEWPAGSRNRLLQSDLLHPKAEGTICLLIHVLDFMVQAREDLDEGQVEWSAEAIRARLLEATREERGTALERERRREERRRRRAERDERGGGGDGGGGRLIAAGRFTGVED